MFPCVCIAGDWDQKLHLGDLRLATLSSFKTGTDHYLMGKGLIWYRLSSMMIIDPSWISFPTFGSTLVSKRLTLSLRCASTLRMIVDGLRDLVNAIMHKAIDDSE